MIRQLRSIFEMNIFILRKKTKTILLEKFKSCAICRKRNTNMGHFKFLISVISESDIHIHVPEETPNIFAGKPGTKKMVKISVTVKYTLFRNIIQFKKI